MTNVGVVTFYFVLYVNSIVSYLAVAMSVLKLA